MEQVLQNNKGEKVLTAVSISNLTVSSFFETPNFYGIFFFKRGKGYLTLDTKRIETNDYGVFFFYPYQKLSFSGTFEGSLIQFHPDFFCIDIHARDVGCQGLLFNNFFGDAFLHSTEEKYNYLFQYFLDIKNELVLNDIGKLDMVSSHLKMLLIEAVRLKKSKQLENTPPRENVHYQIEKLIEDNFHQHSSMDFYANQLGVSLTTFNRLCKKYFQNNFVTLLTLKRIAIAKNKLFLTNIPIKVIAYEVGYKDPLYFSRVFKKYCEISPKEFRTQLQNNRLI